MSIFYFLIFPFSIHGGGGFPVKNLVSTRAGGGVYVVHNQGVWGRGGSWFGNPLVRV